MGHSVPSNRMEIPFKWIWISCNYREIVHNSVKTFFLIVFKNYANVGKLKHSAKMTLGSGLMQCTRNRAEFCCTYTRVMPSITAGQLLWLSVLPAYLKGQITLLLPSKSCSCQFFSWGNSYLRLQLVCLKIKCYSTKQQQLRGKKKKSLYVLLHFWPDGTEKKC